MKTEDGYIVHQCLNGDKSAFAILIDKYKAAVFAIAYDKLRNFHDAQDVAQEVFIKAFQKLGTLKNYDKFAVWLHSITNNLCKNYIRSQSRRPDSEFIEDQKESLIDSNSMRSFKDDIENEMINDALNSLPEIYRQVLTLHYLGGMKDSEIAEFLGMSHTNVRQKLMKARTQLKEEMISMMDRTFEEQKLQAGFTFRIFEMVKRIKINPITQAKNLPWGLSLATGLLIAVLSINPALISFDHIGTPIYSPLPVESKVLKVGEIPVDVVKISNIAILSSKVGKGNGGEPENIQNASSMAPQGEDGILAKKADMPTARFSSSSSVVNGKIYVIGGYSNDILSVVEEYDPATNKWAEKADMPTARNNLASSVVNGKIYAIGGWNPKIGSYLSIVEEYNPVTDKWIKKADMPTARGYLATSVLDGKIYAIGGSTWNNGQSFATVEEYDPVKDEWTKKSDMPTARRCLATSVLDGKIYAIGGYVLGGFDVPAVEEYDPVADKWIKKTDMPTARSGLTTNEVNGKIYAIGGWNGSTLSTVEAYDPATDKWAKEADMPIARNASTASEVNGKIYVIGGDTGAFNGNTSLLSTVEEYTPEGWQSISQQGKLPNTWGKIKAK